MSRPNPIQYAERLYAAIRAANFSPMSFLAFGSAVKDGVDLRRIPRIAAEPFMRVVGEMLDLEEETAEEAIVEAAIAIEPANNPSAAAGPTPVSTLSAGQPAGDGHADADTAVPPNPDSDVGVDRRGQ